MRIFIISDLEGVNGVLNFNDWCIPSGKRNEIGCNFLTEEVNAVADGFFQGGATEVIVFDGHGAAGSIRGEKLDPRVALQRGRMDFPIMNNQVDALAFVGLHAKAGTANAHLAHTQTEEAIDFRINGVSLGEFGQSAYAYSELNVPTIFAAGDSAMTREAVQLVPEIVTAAVKEGFNAPQDGKCSADELFVHESSALHYPRLQVLSELRTKAALAAEKFKKSPQKFAIKPLPPENGSYIAQAEYRATSKRIAEEVGYYPARRIKTSQQATICGVLREFYALREWCDIDGKFVTEL